MLLYFFLIQNYKLISFKYLLYLNKTMFRFTKELSLGFLEFCGIHEFINIACLSKEYLQDIQYYFKTKNKIYKNLNLEKTIKNCLLRIETIDISELFYEIVKVVKLKHLKNGNKENFKIYYWCISAPATIGSVKNGFRTVIYPNHTTICEEDLINGKNLIPFR